MAKRGIDDKVQSGESVVVVLKREGEPNRVIDGPPPPVGDEDPFEIVLAIRDRRTNKLYKYEVKQ